MVCPVCRHPMQPLQVGPLALDQCPDCGVLWFDARELRQFLSLAGPEPASEESAAALPTQVGACPRCRDQPLDRAYWRGIPVALCDRCSGVLLTASALAAVRTVWARLERPRAPAFQLPPPEEWEDYERQFLDMLIGGL